MMDSGVVPSTLSDSSFNRWLASLPRHQTTRSNYRRMGLTLWRHAVDLGLAEHCPKKIVRVKPLVEPPIAWTLGELGTLVATAHTWHGCFKRSHCPMSLFYEAWLLAGFETGLRFSDLHGLTTASLRHNRLMVRMNKTGTPTTKVLTERCARAMAELAALGDGKTIFKWAIAEKQLRIHFSRLCRAAGVSGTPKWLRRSGATHCEAKQRGSAKKFLGHLSEGLAMKYYVDQTLLPDECPTPPEIPTQRTTQGQCFGVASEPSRERLPSGPSHASVPWRVVGQGPSSGGDGGRQRASPRPGGTAG